MMQVQRLGLARAGGPGSARSRQAARRRPSVGSTGTSTTRTVAHNCACGGSCPRCSGSAANGTRVDRGWELDGIPAIASFEDAGDLITIDGPISPPAAAPVASPSPALPSAPGTPAAATCPTRIKVVSILPLVLKANNITEGVRTGVGGIAVMEVGDSSGRDWAGTAIHENINSRTNTCKTGTEACPNSQGQGGSGGSTFKVGDPMSGFVSLPSRKNSFYDLHMFAMGPSVLHQNNLQTCEQTCRQVYDCGGQVFGPVFTIHRTMTRDTIMSDGKAADVTRVKLEKPQDRSAPGDFPAPDLPPGDDYG